MPAPAPTARRPGYMVQLDALRAFSVLAVMYHHLAPALFPGLSLAAWAAVRLFFVLSGFLVTGILLRARDAVDAGQGTAGAALRRFHVRRMLRILPVYYGVILGLALFNAGEVRETLWWHLAFLSNVKFVIDGWHHAYIGQFWFLAAQEQFYLFWPLLMLTLPRRWLLPVILVTILIGPLYRVFALNMGWTLACEALLPANLDTLGLGALLAWVTHGGSTDRFRTLPWSLAAWLAAAMVIAMEWPAVLHGVGLSLSFASRDLLMGLVSVVIVSHAAAGYRGRVGRVMTWPPILYLGTVSYGAFAYHLILGGIVAWAARAAGLSALPALLTATVAVALTIGAASMSWHFVEQPISRLKSR